MDLDYKKLKFKSGLEIHQQLDTNKLFCNCLSVLRNDEPDFEVCRKLHAVAGESGEIDVAARYQASLKKEFVYQGYNTTCLVELDEEPPYEINQDALKIALQISILLNCKIIPITQIMRKTVIDGSNTSGFQRTVLIARDGYVETSSGKIGINTICLEEDSARKVNEDGKKKIYRLDRLGIPLIEIVTSPDISFPEQAKEVALHIGDILRSCKVKRGIGTIRQDVNISIRGENRVELKGVQDMKMFIKIIENEIKRQLKLSDSSRPTNSEVRNALADGESEFIRPMPGADRMYPETDLPLLKISKELINHVKKTLPKLRGEIKRELEKTGLNKEMIGLLLSQNKIEDFKQFLKIYNKPNFIAKMILLFPKEIASKTGKQLNEIEDLLFDFYGDVLIALTENKISESDVKNVLMKFVLGKNIDEALKIEKADLGEIEEKILKIIRGKPGLSPKAYMGLIMAQMKGKIDGKKAMEVVNKVMKN